MVFRPFSTQSAKPRCRVLGDSLDHDNKIPPFHRVTLGVGIIFRYPEPSRLKTLDIHHHPSVLGVQKLHQLPAAAYKDEDIAVAHIGAHTLLDNPDQRVDSLAHIGAARTQMIAHRIVQTEHGSGHALRQHFHQHPLAAPAKVSLYSVRKG